MTDRDRAEIKEIMREVIREELSDSQWYTLAEMMNRAGVSRDTIWRWEKMGCLKIKKIGNRKLYKEIDQ